MVFGYFDYIILIALIFINIKFWKIEIKQSGCCVGLVFYGFILPFSSMLIELTIVKNTIGIMDNFEVLYTYLKFPIYWVLGIIQLILFAFRMNYQNFDSNSENN